MIDHAQTMRTIRNPEKGARFHENYCFWLYIVKVTRKHVWTMHASAPCSFPKDGILKKRTHEEFEKYMSYDWAKDKSWTIFVDNNHDVSGWLKKGAK